MDRSEEEEKGEQEEEEEDDNDGDDDDDEEEEAEDDEAALTAGLEDRFRSLALWRFCGGCSAMFTLMIIPPFCRSQCYDMYNACFCIHQWNSCTHIVQT